MKRRNFIKNGLVGAMYVSSPMGWTETKQHKSVENAHLYAAHEAKKLGIRDPLKILVPQGCESNVIPVTELFKTLSGISTSLIPVSVDDINAKMFLSAGSQESAYDVALPATFGLPDLAESKVIADLTAYREKHEPEGFMNNALYSLGDFYRGKFYGYQTDGDAYLMFYNQLLVDAQSKARFEDSFGYAYRVPRTWAELDTQMAFFHKPEKGVYGGALFRTPDYMAWEWWVRYHAKGELPLADDLTPQIDSQNGVAALEELVEVSRFLYPESKSNGLFANWEAYAKGKIYANIGWGGTQKFLNKEGAKVKGNMLFAPTPGGELDNIRVSVPYFNWGWNYAVSENSKHKEAAYLFTLFAASPVPSTISVREPDGFFDPFRSAHYNDAQIIKTYSAEFLQAHKTSMENCIPDFYLSGQSEYMSELRKYIARANNRELSPKLALRTAAKSWQKLHRKMGKKKQQEQWLFLKRRYPKELLNALS